MIKKITIVLTIFLCLISIMNCGNLGQNSMREPAAGEAAPGFMLKNQDQMNVKLSDFRGKKNVIIVFYPLDFTPV